MDGRRPLQVDFERAAQWRWALWKVGLDPEALFTTLNERHNKVSCDVLSPEAFRHDVSSIVLQAEDLEDFHRRLAARREERLRELQAAWKRVVHNFYSRRPLRFDITEDQIRCRRRCGHPPSECAHGYHHKLHRLETAAASRPKRNSRRRHRSYYRQPMVTIMARPTEGGGDG